MQYRQFKLLPIVFIVLLIFLQYRLWFESGGIIDMMRLKKELSHRLEENAHLKKRNVGLLVQVKHLQQNKDAVESRARNELGMVKKGEIFYQVVDKNPK